MAKKESKTAEQTNEEIKDTEETKKSSGTIARAIAVLVAIFFIVLTFIAIIMVFLPDDDSEANDDTAYIAQEVVRIEDFNYSEFDI